MLFAATEVVRFTLRLAHQSIRRNNLLPNGDLRQAPPHTFRH